MKKFISKMIIYSVIIFTPLLTLNYLYVNTNFYLSNNGLYTIKVYPDNIDLLNLGNSHEMNGIKYEGNCTLIAHNFATSSQPFYYDYQILKSVEDSINDNAVVIIPISLFDWYYNYAEIFSDERYMYNRRYYSVLPASSMLYYDFEDDVKYHYLPVLTAKDNLKYVLEDVDVPVGYNDNTTVNVNAVINNAYRKYDSWFNDVMKFDESVKQDNIKWFKEIIDYCYESGYRLVVIYTPIPYSLTEKFSDEFLKEFENITFEVLSDYPDLLYLDYSDNDEFTNNLTYYQDADHMNVYGANAFTQRLLTDLAANGYIDEYALSFRY